MKLIALMPARNEAWTIGLSLRAALRWCDEAVVLNHASTDETPAILAEIAAEHPGRVEILTESDGTWREMSHRQRLLDAAHARGATHCAIVDADEVLTGNLLAHVRPAIERLPAGVYLRTRMLAMWRGTTVYRDDRSIWSNRDDLALAFPLTDGISWHDNNGYDHHHREPYGVRPGGRMLMEPGGVMHLQFASWRRLVAKHCIYKMVERIRWPEKSVTHIDSLYSQALDEDRLVTRTAPAGWWKPYADIIGHLRLDHVPWQEAECRRLWAEYGAEYFAGLNLYGVANG
jgi:glycosyltransferase involved in cell wall biosynthesis